MARRLKSLASGLAVAIASGCASSGASMPGTTSSDVGPEDTDGPMLGTLYAPAQKFVASYCAGCHWKNGQDPKQKVAYPAFHVDTYEDWATSRTILLAVLDKWNPDGDVMPPPDAVEPSDGERRSILDWIRRNAPNSVDGN
jgi:hypothetical protein